ncbi:MAG: sensor domain-containing diguanylate cyclase [Aquificae bacterium]|nr:sensor domain-containing diguanylate cyclase [Aquificota bacterium]
MADKKHYFEETLRKVADYFFQKLQTNLSTLKYLDGKDLKKVKEKQIQGLVSIYQLYEKGEQEKLKDRLIKLGIRHEGMGIEFSLFTEMINYLELLFIKEIFKDNPTQLEDFFFKANTFFDFLRDYTAVGYLKEYVAREKIFIQEFIEANFEQKTLNIKEIIDRHIAWKEKILEFLSKDMEEPEGLELDPDKCEIGRWLMDNRKRKPETVERLIKIHAELHRVAERIVALKKEKKYVLLVNEYNHLIKTNLLFLSGLLAFLLSQEISELQRDPLTQLLTRRVLKDIYLNIMELSLITQEPFGVAFLDIDDFKKVNDTYSHEVGDRVLSTIARTIKSVIRKSDYVFRYGGEEFVIIVPATTEKDFRNVLEKIRKKVEKTKIPVDGDRYVSVTVSIGGVVVNEKQFVPIEDVIKYADYLMYEAKRQGKNRVIVETFSKEKIQALK